PWISVAQKWGMRILIESHSTRSEAAGDDLDGPTLARMFRAQARAVAVLEKDPTPFLHYLARETGGLLEPHELHPWRLLHAAPQPYTRERFEDTYVWTVKWNMTVPGATYENTVDNRAWQLGPMEPTAGSLSSPPPSRRPTPPGRSTPRRSVSRSASFRPAARR